MSRVMYLVQVWGGYPILLKISPSSSNNAARFITGEGKRTSTKTLMNKVGWMSVYEMSRYQTMISMWKIVRLGNPSTTSVQDNFTR